jgi:tetratricopeptide (TPR) repeat protein
VACPSDDDLSSYLAGRVRGDEAAAIASHVAACRMCEALVDVLGSAAPGGSIPTVPATEATGEPRAGDAIGGYVLQRRVGSGGMGVVWAAYDPELDRLIALKLMRDAAPHLRARFDREVRITARLQHPSIVNIFEAGTWRGEPYYVMKLVRGESLDRRLASHGGLALLPAVIAVVDALAYAHGEGVIHRDLKPENVLVGEFGEAVVIDWGLAKRLAEPEDSEPGLARGSGDGGTVAGAVLGTPAYMPPEQARGEAVDARADVYALGAILYTVLAGSRPYADARDVVAAVIAGPPAPLSRDVPAELATIVERAMARDATARYPSARELADDLRRFQTGQLVASHRYSAGELLARWVRRHRAAVAVAAIAIAVLATGGVVSVRRILAEKQRATEQEQHAEQQRAEVEKLLTFMLVDLQGQLAPIGKVPLLEKIAAQAEDYFARSSDGDPHIQVKALIAVGNVQSAKGNSRGALDRFALAERIARVHLAALGDDPAWLQDLAEAETRSGLVRMQQGDLPGAATTFRDALAIAAKLGSDADLASTHDVLGDVLEAQGDVAGALAEHRAALAVDERLAAHSPDAMRMRALALQHVKIGQLLETRVGADGGLPDVRTGIAIMANVVAAEPTAAEHARDLASFHATLGRLLAIRGDEAAALPEFRAALAIVRPFAEREPENIRLQADVADDLSFVGQATTAPEEALETSREARAIRERLAARDPASSQWQSDLRWSSLQIAITLQQRLGRHAEAVTEARKAIAVGQLLEQRDPTNTDWLANLEQSYAILGEALGDLGKRDDAIEAQRAGLAIAERLIATNPDNLDWKRDVSGRHSAIGELLEPVDRARASVEYSAALEITKQMLHDRPDSEQLAEDLAYLKKKLTR